MADGFKVGLDVASGVCCGTNQLIRLPLVLRPALRDRETDTLATVSRLGATSDWLICIDKFLSRETCAIVPVTSIMRPI